MILLPVILKQTQVEKYTQFHALVDSDVLVHYVLTLSQEYIMSSFYPIIAALKRYYKIKKTYIIFVQTRQQYM